jgi:predicted nuclease with TOPRIM domain
MGLITDLLKDIPLSAVLREKMASAEQKYAALDTENAILKDDKRDLQVRVVELERQVANLKQEIETLAHIDDDPASTTLELTDWLTKHVPAYGVKLIQFDLVAQEIHRRPEDIAECFIAACEKADLEIVDQTKTVARVRRRDRQAFQ